MAAVKNVSIRLKLMIVTGTMMVILAAVVGIMGSQQSRGIINDSVEQQNNMGIRTLVYFLREAGIDVRYELDAEDRITRVTWSASPTLSAVESVVATNSITGLDPTIFEFDPETQDFTRLATTIVSESGFSTIGTTLNRNGTYDALINGRPYIGSAEVRGNVYRTVYVPVYGANGNLEGALANARPVTEVQALLTRHSMAKSLFASTATVIALSACFLALRMLLSPLKVLTREIVALSEGTCNSDVGFQENMDEIGEIARGVLVLQTSMRDAARLQTEDSVRQAEAERQRLEQKLVVDRLSDGLSRLSQLDLTTRIDSTDDHPFPVEYDTLRTSFNELVGQLSETVLSIRSVAEEVNADAREMAGSSADLSARTENQAATLQESAAALEQLSQSIQSTAENAADAEATTSENREVTKATGDIVKNAIAAMEEIESSAQQINQIISVIDDIAFQTNLLALNAGVEAARAGEAGRGFAVVASEVRALAQHSSASAQEIKTLIAASSQQVEAGSGLVKDTGKALDDIIVRVERVASLVSDIAVSAREQSVGVSEINDGVRELDAATQHNAAMAEQASAASEGLTNAADKMARRLGHFKIDYAPTKRNWAAEAAVIEMPQAIENSPGPHAPAPVSDHDAFRGF